MSKFIDAFGKACPMPVVLAKKELDAGEKDLTVAVDNEIAVGNLKRLAGSNGLEVKVENVEGGLKLRQPKLTADRKPNQNPDCTRCLLRKRMRIYGIFR